MNYTLKISIDNSSKLQILYNYVKATYNCNTPLLDILFSKELLLEPFFNDNLILKNKFLSFLYDGILDEEIKNILIQAPQLKKLCFFLKKEVKELKRFKAINVKKVFEEYLHLCSSYCINNNLIKNFFFDFSTDHCLFIEFLNIELEELNFIIEKDLKPSLQKIATAFYKMPDVKISIEDKPKNFDFQKPF